MVTLYSWIDMLKHRTKKSFAQIGMNFIQEKLEIDKTLGKHLTLQSKGCYIYSIQPKDEAEAYNDAIAALIEKYKDQKTYTKVFIVRDKMVYGIDIEALEEDVSKIFYDGYCQIKDEIKSIVLFDIQDEEYEIKEDSDTKSVLSAKINTSYNLEITFEYQDPENITFSVAQV